MKTTRSSLIALAVLSVSLLSSSLISLAQTSTVRARVTQPVDMQNLVTLRGNVHPLARPEFDQGPAPDDLPMGRMLLVLQRGSDQETALRQLLDDQQVKSSARFHQWLTPEEFGQQFGPADSDIQAVTGWLASQGFMVTKVAAGRTVIEFSGTAGLVRQVLGTEIHRFRVNGEDRWANISDPQIPAALAPVVAGFASLNNFPRKPMTHNLGTISRSKTTGEVQPLFSIEISNGYYFALGPADFATIYNVLPLWNASTPTDGTGETIAVVGETNINPQDVADFRSMFGLPANAPNIILNGPDPGINGDEVEADLDVQWSGAVAKGATIDLVVSESTETTAGVDLSALYIIDNNLAPVMSESYGWCEAYLGAGGNQFHSTMWEQAASQGITVLMAAGDSGPAACDSWEADEMAAHYGLAVSGYASTPFNVAVGGTDFNVTDSNYLTYWNLTNNSAQSSALSYIPEIPWNDSCAASGLLSGCSPPPNTTYFYDSIYLIAGSGGPSSCTNPSGVFPNETCSGNYSKPSWQSGPGVPSDGARDIPDVSLFAGDGFHGSFYVVCQMDANFSGRGNPGSCDLNAPYTDFQSGSGTSASVQAFAGIMAMVNQRYGRQGNANYVLYPMAAQSGASCDSGPAVVKNSSCIFYDVTTGNNSVICQGGSPNCNNTSVGQYGIMVSGSPALAAYPATSGYDLATGLGSVNVANLVNNWKSNFTPATTSLSLSTNPVTNPISLTHGQPINFTINVGQGSGTPTGDVSLIAQTGSSSSNVTGIGPFTLSGGTATGSTIMLPGGSYSVTAHYAGNGTFAAGDSTPGIPVTVNKESSLAELRLATPSGGGDTAYNVTTVPYGSPYILRMDVTNSSGQLCAAASATGEQFSVSYPCPTGTVTITPPPTDQNPPPGTVAGQYKLNSQGYAEDVPIQQPAGQYNFVASYGGDNSYTATTSATLPVTFTKAETTTTFNGLPTSSVGGGVILTVAIATTSSGAAPTGTLVALNGQTVISSPYYVSGSPYSPSTGTYASAKATFNVALPVGTDSISIEYSGDSNYASSTSPVSTVNVTDFSISANPTSITISAGQTATSTITISPLGGFSGTVTLSSPGCTICTVSPSQVTLTGTGPATALFSFVTVGSSSRVPPASQGRIPPPLRWPAKWLWTLSLTALAILSGYMLCRKGVRAWQIATVLVIAGAWACGGSGNVSSPAPAAPGFSVAPASIAFPKETLGWPSTPQYVAVTNTGNGMLNISNVVFTGPAASDYSETGNCLFSVAPGSNCQLNVTFQPTATGSRTASLVFNDNASGSPQTVSVSGTGYEPPTTPGGYGLGVLGTSGSDAHGAEINITVQ